MVMKWLRNGYEMVMNPSSLQLMWWRPFVFLIQTNNIRYSLDPSISLTNAPNPPLPRRYSIRRLITGPGLNIMHLSKNVCHSSMSEPTRLTSYRPSIRPSPTCHTTSRVNSLNDNLLFRPRIELCKLQPNNEPDDRRFSMPQNFYNRSTTRATFNSTAVLWGLEDGADPLTFVMREVKYCCKFVEWGKERSRRLDSVALRRDVTTWIRIKN